MARKLEFFWDVGSPYTYLASTQLSALAERAGAELVYRPFLLGGVFRSSGNTMPAAVPAKAQWMLKDLQRWAKQYGVAMILPPDVPFPINALLPMRVAMAADQAGKGVDFCNAIFRAYWGEGRDVSQPEELSAVIQQVGLDAAELLAAAQTPVVKDALRSNSDEAVQRGAFGAPTFFVGDEMFWGNDRLHQIEALLSRMD